MKGATAMADRTRNGREGNTAVAGSTTFSWPAITLAEFSHRLSRFTDAPVVDSTSLPGNFSITISFSQDPNASGDTIFDAVEQLGLELQPRKVAMDILIVDHANRVPSAN